MLGSSGSSSRSSSSSPPQPPTKADATPNESKKWRMDTLLRSSNPRVYRRYPGETRAPATTKWLDKEGAASYTTVPSIDTPCGVALATGRDDAHFRKKRRAVLCLEVVVSSGDLGR